MTQERDGSGGADGFGLAGAGAALLVALAALLFGLRPLGIALPESDLDGSWMVVLGEAALRPARWGVDLAFTYGPASALVTRYLTEPYLAVAVPSALGLAALFGLAFARLATAGAPSGPRRGAWVLAAALAESAALLPLAPQIPDAFFFVLPFNVFLLDLYGGRRHRLLPALAAAAVGGVALSKSSYGALALALFVLSDLHSAAVLRRVPVLCASFALGFLVVFLAFGQHLSDLPAYLRLQGEVAAGYGEAMYAVGSRWELACFGLAALATVVLALTRGDDRLRGTTAAAGLALVLLLGFKAGFLRQDTHPQIAWSLLGLAGLSSAVTVVPRRSPAAAATLALASLALIWIAAPLFLAVETGEPVAAPAVAAAAAGDMAEASSEVRSWGALLRDPAGFAARLRDAKAEAFATIRQAHPLPALEGTVDIIPSAQTSVLAAGLDYRPRPSFQDYSTYTAGLIAANVAFYTGPEAPDWVLFGIGGLDDRYPAATEGALWPVLIARYEPVRRAGDLLLLHRRAVPLAEGLGPWRHATARLGQRFDVPPGPQFARLTVRETPLGRLAALVFRPPALMLRVTLADGTAQGFRFVPALAAGGFLLSPLVDGIDGFARLAVGEAADRDGSAVVGAEVGGSALARWFYAPEIGLDLAALSVPVTAPSPEARALRDGLSQGQSWRSLARRIGPPGALRGDHLAAGAPTRLGLPVAGARHLRLGFGIEDGAWTEGRVSGVCFAVRDAAPAGAELWRRCLDPRDTPADRGAQVADVPLPADLASVTLDTECRGSCAWGWAYWNDAQPLR